MAHLGAGRPDHRGAGLGALRALAAPEFVFDDRRRRSLVRGEIEVYVRNLAFVRSWPGRRVAPELLATAGERLALDRIRFVGDPDGGAFTGEFLRLTEIDGDGRLRAVLHFDAGERAAARDELGERYARSDPSRRIPVWVDELGRAFRARDVDRIRAALPPGFVFRDHRRTGLGQVEGELYLTSVGAIFALAPDWSTATLYRIAEAPHGSLWVARTGGTLAQGGEFESLFVRLIAHPQDQPPAVELFELDDLERARARFEELGRG